MSSYLIPHERVKGDTFLPLGVQFKVDGTIVDLTDKTVQFKMVADGGSVKRDWTAASIVDATNGQAQYDFASADVDTAGVFWAWFRYGSDSEWATFPPAGQDSKSRSFKIVINDTV